MADEGVTCPQCHRTIGEGGRCSGRAYRNRSGELVGRISYGSESEPLGHVSDAADQGLVCPACRVAPDALHHMGCEGEQCPQCGESAMACLCIPALTEVSRLVAIFGWPRKKGTP